MPLGKVGHQKSYLDPELCYAVWLITGSIRRAVSYLSDHGVRGRNSDVSAMALRNAANRSENYHRFLENRKKGIIQQESATQEEIQEAKRIIAERLPAQIQAVEDMLDAVYTPSMVRKGKIVDRGGDW